MKFTGMKGKLISLHHLRRLFQIIITSDYRDRELKKFVQLSLLNRCKYWLTRSRNLFHMRYSIKIKSKFKDLIDLKNKEYIIFPLQFEPEATSSVRGFPNHDQIKIIRHIAKNLPDEIYLVVKEHKGNEGYRLVEDQLQISRLRNVILVDTFCNNNELISNSLGVVTINSTFAVEAYFNQKPIVLLGNCYWMNLKGLTKFSTYLEINKTNIKQLFSIPSNKFNYNEDYFSYFLDYLNCVKKEITLPSNRSKNIDSINSKNINNFINALIDLTT